MVLVLAAAVATFATLKPVKVLPRIRLAPGFALTDQSGARFTSEMARGQVTLYSFVPSVCDESCQSTLETVGEIRRRAVAEVDLGDDVELRFVTIVLDGGATTRDVAAAAGGAGADGDVWRFVGGSERDLRNVVNAGFKRSLTAFDGRQPDLYAGYVIVDGWGVVRGDYHYPTLQGDADKLVYHLRVLGGELRHRGGVASLAYGAAHVFSCYP